MVSKPPFDFSRKPLTASAGEKLIPPEAPRKREMADQTDHYTGAHTCHFRTLAQAVPAGYDMAKQSYFWDKTKPVEEGQEAPTFPPLMRGVSIISSSPQMCQAALTAIQSIKDTPDAYNLAEAVDPIKKPFPTDWFTALVHMQGKDVDGEDLDIVYGIFDFNDEPNIIPLRNHDFGGGVAGSIPRDMLPFIATAEDGPKSMLITTLGYPEEDIVVYSVTDEGQFVRQYITGAEARKSAVSAQQWAALRIAKPQGTA